MGYYKKVDGKDVYLASIDLNDAEKYMKWVNNTSRPGQIVFDGYRGKKIETVDQARDELNRLAVENAFAIIDKGTNEFIGLTGFANTQAMNQRSAMWIKINTDIDYGRQVKQGAEALDLMLTYAFDIMNLNSIVLDVPVFNQQGLDICKESSMSFMYERKTSAKFSDGKFYNMISFQCFKEMFKRNCEEALPTFDKSGYIIKGLSVNEEKLRTILTGNGVRLSKYQGQEEYISRMATFLNDPEISIPLGEYKINWNDYRARKKLEEVDYIIEADDNIIGYINLFRKDLNNGTADLEIMIGDKTKQKKGYATEAMNLFLDEQFQNGPYTSIISSIFEFNEASHRLHEHVGFEKIGTRNEGYYAYGKLNDMDVFEINRESYQKKLRKNS